MKLANLNKKLEYGQYARRKCYIQDDPQKKNASFFRGAPKIFKNK